MKFKKGTRVVIVGSESWTHDGYIGLRGLIVDAWPKEHLCPVDQYHVSFIFCGKPAEVVFKDFELDYDALEELARI